MSYKLLETVSYKILRIKPLLTGSNTEYFYMDDKSCSYYDGGWKIPSKHLVKSMVINWKTYLDVTHNWSGMLPKKSQMISRNRTVREKIIEAF